MQWITTDNVTQETWSRLLEFSNTDIAVHNISTRHGAPKNSSEKTNYRKQAQQIRTCLLQAKEYFDAACESSLVTSPNHSYYGMISLASSVMLMLGDGRKSLDILRRDTTNRSHGLKFTTEVSSAAFAANRLELLESSYVETLLQGHFKQWYEVLPSGVNVYGKLTRVESASARKVSLEQLGVSPSPKFSDLVGKKWSLLHLMKYLPDLNEDLRKYGVAPASSRWNIEFQMGANSSEFVWLIHGAQSRDALDSILANFAGQARFMQGFDVHIDSTTDAGAIVRFTHVRTHEEPQYRFPCGRVALTFDQYCYAEDHDIHEFVDFYMGAFGLSMLARYYPDIWMASLDSNCLAARLIDRFTRVIAKKGPMLALSLLSGQDLFISPTRAPWAS